MTSVSTFSRKVNVSSLGQKMSSNTPHFVPTSKGPGVHASSG